MRFSVGLSAVLASTLVLSGCATVNKMRDIPIESGLQKTFHAEYNEVLRVSRTALMELELAIREEYEVSGLSKRTTRIIAEEGWSVEIIFVTGGVFVSVVVQELNDTETAVRVVTKKRLATDALATDDYTQALIRKLEHELR